jgi:hypothetical protein
MIDQTCFYIHWTGKYICLQHKLHKPQSLAITITGVGLVKGQAGLWPWTGEKIRSQVPHCGSVDRNDSNQRCHGRLTSHGRRGGAWRKVSALCCGQDTFKVHVLVELTFSGPSSPIILLEVLPSSLFRQHVYSLARLHGQCTVTFYCGTSWPVTATITNTASFKFRPKTGLRSWLTWWCSTFARDSNTSVKLWMRECSIYSLCFKI